MSGPRSGTLVLHPLTHARPKKARWFLSLRTLLPHAVPYACCSLLEHYCATLIGRTEQNGGKMILDKSRAGYILVIERTRTGFSAYVPDLPGCIATGRTLDQTKKLMDGAIVLHVRGTRADELRVQRPRSLAELRRRRLLTQKLQRW